ncbi:MAG: ribosome biogenesis GTP-binding protein YihA/YsxC [Acholeplasmataceae bacterium]
MFNRSEYVKSITDPNDRPRPLPELLLLGRSNVGKSSFINALTNRKNLARTSQNPGKTVTLNYYLIDEAFYLVDAPGYGYAKRSKKDRAAFIAMIEDYLLKATDLKAICLLIDFKVGPTEMDLATYRFLTELHPSVIVIATKKDRVPKTHQRKQESLIANRFERTEPVFVVSNRTNEGIEDVRSVLAEIVGIR